MLTASLGKQDKQLVLSQGLSLTVPIATNALPSLIKSPTDKSTNTKNNNNIRTTPKQTKQSSYQGFWPKPKCVYNGESY